MKLADGLSIPEIRLTDPVVFFPVRHHSPACAFQVGRVIERIRPAAILIEGPANANPLIPLLASGDATMPLAIFATCVRPRKGRLPERDAAYYPFCDYSPELVAIREGVAAGADVRFIDLDFPAMVAADASRTDERQRNLLEEKHLRRSALLAAACQRSGARDHDDLWDCLFETGVSRKEPETFIHDVLAYCALARADATDEELKGDGTLHREAAMADAIREAAASLSSGKQILAITGGYHTVVLPDLVAGTRAIHSAKPKPAGQGDAQLIRYNFPQLDRLNGYSSGMPSPEFYQRSWHTLIGLEQGSEPFAEWIVELSRELRGQRLPVSPADEIACLDQVLRLARLRGHAQPSREDLLDGFRSVFVKGEHDIDGIHILAQARKLLCGHRVGKVPAGAGESPLVADFRRLSTELGLDLEAVERRELVLDLYRKERHRMASRMMYQLGFLEVPFANRVRGPDFASGENLDRIQEVWSYQWEPATEAALVEKSLYGSTLEEAVLSLLLERFEREASKSASLATRFLVEACRMGLHRQANELAARVAGILRDDPDFASLVAAFGNLVTLQISREPLEASRLDGVEMMAGQAYELACYRLPDLVHASDERAGELVTAMNDLAVFSQGLPLSEIESGWLWHGLRSLDAEAGAPALIHGAVSGLLFSFGRWTEANLVERLEGHLGAATFDQARGGRYVEGLFAIARDVVWNVPAVIDRLDAWFREIDEEEFRSVVPHLRLAFSGLTAREIDRVARGVGERSGLSGRDFEVAWNSSLSAQDRQLASWIDQRVSETLAADHLDDLPGLLPLAKAD